VFVAVVADVALVAEVAVVALPLSAPVKVVALMLFDESRSTIVDAVAAVA
jgi:hypothetical protein